MLISNKIVFLKTPKNASTSVFYSIINSNLNFDEGNPLYNETYLEEKGKLLEGKQHSFKNYHQTYEELIEFFPPKKYKYISIRRDSTDRFISGIRYIQSHINKNPQKYKPKIDLSKLNTNEIINFFIPIIQKVHTRTFTNELVDIIVEYFCDDREVAIETNWMMFLKNLQSQYFWGVNKCDVIFEYNQLNKFEEFITKELGVDFKLVHTNQTLGKIDLKLERTAELEDFVKKYIDSPFLLKKLI